MANIKTEFYAAIARLQKQLENNSLSKDDKAATEKYIKDTLSTFRENLSSSEKKMSVDDVKALAKEINDADTKKEDLVNKINAPVKKEEIQDVATNLENLKKEFDDLNTHKFSDIKEKISIMLAKASDGKISEEDNNELSKVNNEFQAIVKDLTSLLKTT